MLRYQVVREGGTPVLLCPMEHVESVSVGLWFRVGSRAEPARAHGAAHFLEHMLFKGTKRRSARQISWSVESLGGDLNAFTTEEMTCYFARADGDHLGVLCDVLFDMVQSSVFEPEEFERERGVILEELKMYEDQPQVVVGEVLQEAMWPGSGLGRSVTGSVGSITGMRRADVMEFWKRNYHPGTMAVSLAGNFDVPHVVEVVRLLGGRQRRKVSGARVAPVRPRSRRLLAVSLRRRPVQQTNVAWAAETFGRADPRRFALKVLSVLLGENSSSRLFQVVRERHGMAYSVHTAVNQFQETGSLVVQMGLEAGQVEPALRLVSKELERLREKAPAQAELQRAKEYAIGQLKLGLESTSNQMMWMGESMLGHGRVFDPHEVIEGLRAVSGWEVQALARQLFVPGRMTLACVGPVESGLSEKGLLACCRG